MAMPSYDLFPDYSAPGNQSDRVPRSPETIGELPESVVVAAREYFSQPAFDLETAVPRCNVSDLKPALIDIANKLYARLPYKVICAYRSVAWDRQRGRSGKSSHCKGYAMDIQAIDHNLRRKYVAELCALGVKRIGVGKTSIHFDVDPDKAPSMWLYYPDNMNKTF